MKKLLNKVEYFIVRKLIRPVFIVGCGHSGTSIMLSLLDNHSNTYAVKSESKVFYQKGDVLQKTILKWYKKSKDSNKRIIVEKTPNHIYKIEKILNLFPKAKIIIMLRDGRDVACSIRERTGDFKEGVERWVSDNSEGYKYWNNPRVSVIKLEDLVKKPEEVSERICKFIGVNYEARMLKKQGKEKKMYYSKRISDKKEFEDKEKSLETHLERRNWQINQGLFSDTNRWKNEFSDEDFTIFNDIAKDYLELYGYCNNEE